MRVLITGATGLIGREVAHHLFEQGHELIVLTRNPTRAAQTLLLPAKFMQWNADADVAPKEAFQNVGAVIHLAGESVAAGRWTEKQKQKIFSSRVSGTRNLASGLKAALSEGYTQDVVWVGAGGVGIYGNRGDEEVSEESSHGSGFLASVCEAWEKESNVFSNTVRVVQLRIGMVLSSQGGALDKMLTPFSLGVGGKIGSGKQWMSWIHIRDLVGLVDLALKRREIHGVMNATAPNPETNEDFSKKLAAALQRTSWLPVPGVALKLLLGEMSELVLDGARVLPKRAMSLGYTFQFSKLEEALREAVPCGGDHVLETVQFIAQPREKVFEFFSDAENLEAITPEFLNFTILNVSTPTIERGTLIDYELKIRGLPVKWRTEIEEWNPPNSFVDVQSRGPYKKWHHTHTFTEAQGGTLVKDRVLYRLPGERFGKAVAGSWVRKDVDKIFAFRASELQKQFSESLE